MTRTVKRLLLVVAFALVGIAATQGTATAQFNYTCIVTNGYKCYVIYDPCGRIISIKCLCGSTGSGTFTTPRAIPFAGPLNVALTPVSVNVTLVDAQYGTITTRLKLNATSPVTSIISNNPPARFPATGRIQFYADATLESKPGIKYNSKTPLTFVNTNLQSVDPFNNEVFILTKDVEFYNSADPAQVTQFKLQANSTNVTLGS
ncbi:MAG TPA: hypothetical protein VHI13_18240 [Candidatus Kapabacteria bacterium]|nr:hypothetical protein [Candidatus Kapabacteria bacterium]